MAQLWGRILRSFWLTIVKASDQSSFLLMHAMVYISSYKWVVLLVLVLKGIDLLMVNVLKCYLSLKCICCLIYLEAFPFN